MLNFDIALNTLIGLTIFLVLLFLFLLGYTFWSRKKIEYWNRYEQKFRDYFFSLLLDYAEQSASHLEADEIIKKISRRSQDYAFFIKLLNELDNILDGTERERLNTLIEHPLFANFYESKLFEHSTDSKIYACIYFQKSGKINNRVLTKLLNVSKSYNLKLAFAATKALQSAEEWSIRKDALLRFFKRDDVSELMVLELLHIFDSGLVQDRQKVGKAFKNILLKNIDPHSKNIIVRYMGYQQFYECSDFLHQYLQRIQYSTKKETLFHGLIVALGELHHTEAAETIKSYYQKRNNTSIRMAGVKTLSLFGGEENITFLLNHLLEAEFSIRKAIIQELTNGDESRMVLLTQFIRSIVISLKQLKKQQYTPDDLTPYLNKILDIISGIKIALNHPQSEIYAR